MKISLNRTVAFNLKLFIVCLCIYALNRLTNQLYYVPYASYVLRYHFNDYLAGIVFLAYLNIILGISVYKEYSVVRWDLVILTGIIIGIFWEFITPMYKSDSTSDIIDVFCYILGAISYKLIIMYRKHRFVF